METIRAYVGWNDYTKTHYYRDFEAVESLPKVDEVYYEDDGRIETVKAIEKVKLDTEQGNDEVYRYFYYKIIVNCYDKDNNENDEDEYFVCISEEYILREELKNMDFNLETLKVDLFVISEYCTDWKEQEVLEKMINATEELIEGFEELNL